MLQLSDICKMGEDSQMATELIERTLFAMESAFHPLFNVAVATSRLDYRRQENRFETRSNKKNKTSHRVVFSEHSFWPCFAT